MPVLLTIGRFALCASPFRGSFRGYGKDVTRVTSKLQVTIPKAIAQRYGIEPGEEIEWLLPEMRFASWPALRAGTSATASGNSSCSTARRIASTSARRNRSAGPPIAAGHARTCTRVAGLVDTKVLVHRFDARFPDKQRLATEVLRSGIADGSVFLPHQAIIEFVAVASHPLDGGAPLLDATDARREAEELLSQFDVLFPDEELIRIALRGAAAYQLAWFDAHMWAYPERYGLGELLSEDFQHGRLYGTVEVVNPFVEA